MLLINFFLYSCYCTIVGIDLGSDSIKVAVGSKYRAVHLVQNIHAKESTPNIFSYRDDSHWSFGKDAIDQCILRPDSCLKGYPLDDKDYFSPNSLKGYQIVSLVLKQIIQNVKDTEDIDDDIKVVIAIPPSMTNREKSYLYNALRIADINCIKFVTSTYAPIEVYVSEKKYGYRTDNSPVFIDIGHGGVRVSGFEFDKEKIIQKFGQYNDNIGGKSIDENLMKMIMKKYDLKFSNDELEEQKERAFLLSEIRKIREKLTVNPTGLSFDFKSKQITITREDIDESCFEIKQSLNQMIESLKQKNPNLLNSGCIQLLGGCSRIPCLQEYLKKILPNFKLLKTMDVNSAVCIGSCYLISDEIPSSIQVHESLITTEVTLKTIYNNYKIFSYENTESFNPVVRLNNVESNHLLSIIDVNDNNNEFTRFRINNNYFYQVDLAFSINDYLMPVIDVNQIHFRFHYEIIGWEITREELEWSRNIVNSMLNAIKQRLNVEKNLNSIDEYKIYVKNNMNYKGFLDWKNIAFSGICSLIDFKCKNCLENNKIECSDEKINTILHEFKVLVNSILKIDKTDDVDENKTELRRATEELYDLIEYCKLFGTKCNDIERWINSNYKRASFEDIINRMKILKKRVKAAKDYYLHIANV